MGIRKHSVAWGSASFDDASTELAKFATDFEAKILQPVRDRRAANDEVLAIKSVPLGVSRAQSGKPSLLYISGAIVLQHFSKLFSVV